MKSDWATYTIADIAQRVITGKTPPGTLDEYFGGETLFVTPTDMEDDKHITETIRTLSVSGKEKLNKQLFTKGIVVSCIGWQMGKSAIVKQPSVTNQQVNTVVPDESVIDLDFLYYVLKSKRDEIFNLGATATRTPILKKSLFEKISFDAPCLIEQKKIGKLLSQFDDKIQLNTQTNQTLEEMAQAIFKSWFVDFDPVKAKMHGEQPIGMDAATASLFPDKLVESELGFIPEGWEVTKLSKVIDLLNGFAFKSPDYVKEGTFVLRTKNFDSSNSVERLSDDVFLPDEFLESHKKYLCEAYDYHVVMVAASIGKTGMIYPHQLPALRNQNMWCFRPKDESLRFYTKYMVDGLIKLNMGLASGSARAFFKKGDFNSYEFALPSSELLIKFNDVVGNLVKQKGSLLNQNIQLAALRDTLLPKLLSGEIDLGSEIE